MKKFKYLLNAHATIGYISVNINTQRANQIYAFANDQDTFILVLNVIM